MIVVAVLVCLFASGMAGLLNFFKYRSNVERLIQERLVVTGQGIEASIRSSLALGMQFSDLGTLQEKMERELRNDELTRTIDVFDTEGHSLYSTDRLRAARGIPEAWLREAKNSDDGVWSVKDGHNSAVGVDIKNSFGLVIGYVALRYIEADVSKSVYVVAKQIALSSLLTFILTAILSSLALLGVMSRISRDVSAVEKWLDAQQTEGGARPTTADIRGPFGTPLNRFLSTVRKAEANINLLRNQLARGDR